MSGPRRTPRSLRDWRDSLGVIQYDVAVAAECSTGHVSMAERGMVDEAAEARLREAVLRLARQRRDEEREGREGLLIGLRIQRAWRDIPTPARDELESALVAAVNRRLDRGELEASDGLGLALPNGRYTQLLDEYFEEVNP